ncbi:MAG: creatininase family protein [Acidobacteriota bacterium]
MRTIRTLIIAAALVVAGATQAAAQAPANPLWHEQKVKNYLPHMTWPEVQDLLTRTDMVILPVASLEQHGPQGPIGTDFLNGLERAKLIAQRTDVLVAPILFPGNSPYHMAFPGTITLPAETIQLVFFQAAQSLIRHGFKRFLILNSHGGNQIISRYIADRINQETAGIAVELGEAAGPFEQRTPREGPPMFDRHGGVGETSSSLYLTPNLVNLGAARAAPLTHLPHLQAMLPAVVAGDATATRVFLAEALKAEETGKRTSTKDMTETGVWSVGDPKTASAERGRDDTERFVAAAVAFIERWKALRPLGR